MTDENEAVSTSRLNFGGDEAAPVAQEEAVPTEVISEEAAAVNEAADDNEVPFSPPAFLTNGVKQEPEATDEAVNTAVENAAVTTPISDAPEVESVAPTEAVPSIEDMSAEAEQVAEEATAEPVIDGSNADIAQEVAQRRAEDLANAAEPLVIDNKVVDDEIPEVNIELQEDDSIENLRAEQDRINARLKAHEKAQKDAVIVEIKRISGLYDVTLPELIEAFGGLKSKAFGSKAKAKYRDPATGNTWSGRGKPPLWIKGKNKDDFLITE